MRSVSAKFLIRRIHALFGVLPLCVFAILHVLNNARILIAVPFFDRQFTNQDLQHIFSILNFVFVHVPLGLYFLMSLYQLYGSRSNVGRYRFSGNIRYVLQSLCLLLALGFIALHTAHMQRVNPEALMHESLTDLLSMPGMAIVYLIGATAVLFLACFAIWNFFVTWGILIQPKSQKTLLIVLAVFFLILGTLNAATVVRFSALNEDELVVNP